ncbi:hypothetical protein [Polaromonas sp. YR568]|uniref:hypothetical protein n=1 Tax=Polaromonas sp. YR568 TaxID=1855301 RepID=UPI003138079D
MRLKFLLAAYGAAGVSFLATLLRDYVVINFTQESKHFFQLLYIASMAAGFGVNAIAGGSSLLRRPGLVVLFLVGLLVILVMVPTSQRTLFTVALLSSILLMWIAGAQWSRLLVERGWVFSGRVREGIASIVFTIFVFWGLGVELGFLLASACGALFSWLICFKSSLKLPDSLPSSFPTRGEMEKLLRSVILTNVTTFSITYWALIQTAKQGEIFGYEISIAIRFAMYLYQVLTIGAIVLVSLKGKMKLSEGWKLLVIAAGLIVVVSLFLPLKLAIFLIPFSAATLHYGAVLYLQKNP